MRLFGPIRTRGPGFEDQRLHFFVANAAFIVPYFLHASSVSIWHRPPKVFRKSQNSVIPAIGGPGMCRSRSQVRVLNVSAITISTLTSINVAVRGAGDISAVGFLTLLSQSRSCGSDVSGPLGRA